MSDSLLDGAHPLGNEHNRVKAMELIKASAIYKNSIKNINLSYRIEDLSCIIAFKMRMLPSIKSEVINVAANDRSKSNEYFASYLAFDIKTKKFLPFPYSVCGYCNSRHCHLHLSACIFHFCCAQWHQK